MNRLVERLKQYDSSLTVNQLIQKIEEADLQEKFKEETDFNQLKEKYKDVYLKRIEDKSIFGKTLEVYHIKAITNKERNTDWEYIFTIKGDRISFSERDTFFMKLNEGNSYHKFSERDLNKMEVISIDEYSEYLREYHNIKNRLISLIK